MAGWCAIARADHGPTAQLICAWGKDSRRAAERRRRHHHIADAAGTDEDDPLRCKLRGRARKNVTQN